MKADRSEVRRRASAIVISLLLVCGFAVGGASAAGKGAGFDGASAYQFLIQQLQYGPRTPGSQATEKTRKLILGELAKNGFTTSTQEFRAFAPVLGKESKGVNLIGTFPRDAKVKYVISAHYDTRPIGERSADPSQRHTPIPGANDGASGVAILLELARVFHDNPPPCGVALVFFDLEDLGLPTESDGFCLGSSFMAENLPKELADFELGINLDMVGDQDLHLPMEAYSLAKAETAVQELWSIGSQLYPSVFVQEKGRAVYDDHMPFQKVGKAYIDLIDFDYPAWHTVEDSADKCSPDSLLAVGQVLARFVNSSGRR